MENQSKKTIKPLAEILVITDQVPADFYTNDIYDEDIIKNTELTNNLVYTIDDVGNKQAKADAASVRKYAKTIKGFVLEEVNDKTSEVLIWKKNKIKLLDRLLENPIKSLSQFEERRIERLSEITDKITEEINSLRKISGIKEAFITRCTDLTAIVNLTGTITTSGSLTKKANLFIKSIIDAELAEQNRIESRHLILENKCLTADINPPLTYIHLGTDFYAEDDVFNAKVEELVCAEIERKAEMEARIRKQQEAEKQAEIDAALKAQQAEADAIARGKVQIEETEKRTKSIAESKSIVPDDTASKQEKNIKPKVGSVNGKHVVEISVIFKMIISDRVSDKAVENHLMSLLPEKLVSAIENIDTRSC